MTARDDRQVLVVGDGVAGLAVTATLRRAGYDPILLSGGDRVPVSRVARLHPVGRGLLDQIARSTETAPVECGPSGTDEADGPVCVPADSVDAGLAAAVPDDAVRADGLQHLERDGEALRVQFESGVREWFDLVVAADGPDSTVRALRDSSVDAVDATQVEARVTTDSGVGNRREAWTDDGLVEVLSSPDCDGFVRLTTDRSVDESSTGRLRRGLDRIDGVDVCDLTDTVTRTVTQASADGQWADGRVAYCGSAACPQAPATGLRTTLALADARVLADELVAGPSSVVTAAGSYARRRHRHVRVIRESARFDATVEATPGDDSLAPIRRDRAAGVGDCDALGSVGQL